MNKSVGISDIHLFTELDMVYNQVRVLEAKQNETKFKCLGSGQCCKIGLILPMMECASIAFNLNKEYYMNLENKGRVFADEWFSKVKESLIYALSDPDWVWGGETKRHCAFYKGGCTIYGYRPLVCRSFGTITGVDEYCPRERNAYGNIDFYAGQPIKDLVMQFQNLLKKFAKGKDKSFDTVVYMPLGVLSFILSVEEMIELEKVTDDKMWKAVQGWFNYRVHYVKEHGMTLEDLTKEASEAGGQIAFRTKEDED